MKSFARATSQRTDACFRSPTIQIARPAPSWNAPRHEVSWRRSVCILWLLSLIAGCFSLKGDDHPVSDSKESSPDGTREVGDAAPSLEGDVDVVASPDAAILLDARESGDDPSDSVSLDGSRDVDRAMTKDADFEALDSDRQKPDSSEIDGSDAAVDAPAVDQSGDERSLCGAGNALPCKDGSSGCCNPANSDCGCTPPCIQGIGCQVPGSRIGIVHRSGADVQWLLDRNGDGVWDDGDLNPSFPVFGQPGDQAVAGAFVPNASDRIAVFREGEWFVDINGDGRYTSPEMGGEDKHYVFGQLGDIAVVGHFSNQCNPLCLGVFRNSVWLLDGNGNGFWDGPPSDISIPGFGEPGDVPIVGTWRFTGDRLSRIGVFRAGDWLIDADGDGIWMATLGSDVEYPQFGMAGDIPVVGDWNGDGWDEIGVWRPSTGHWMLDLNGNGTWDGPPNDIEFTYGQPGDQPVTGVW